MNRPLHFGLLGHGIADSLSPVIFKHMFEQLEVEGRFDLVDVPPDRFEGEFEPLRLRDGFSVTIPYKERIIPFLDQVSDEAMAIGAVNSVRVQKGRFFGHNTDAGSFLFPLRRAGFAGGRILILGNGGAARAAVWALGKEYARTDITICGRDAERTARFADELRYPDGAKVVSQHITYHELNTDDRYDLVVNCTPVGGGNLIRYSAVPDNFPFRRCRTCYDLVYRPARTLFLSRAEKAGCEIIGGMPMLVRQAVASFALWTESELDEEAVTDEVLAMVSSESADTSL